MLGDITVDDDLSRLSASTLDDQDVLVRALHEIANEAVEGEVVRIAIIALNNTHAGRSYLAQHPIVM